MYLDGKPLAHLGRGAKPAWSPDGEKLATLIANGTDLQILEVRTRNIQRTLALLPQSDRWASLAELAWSPDAARLGYVTPRRPVQVERKDAIVSGIRTAQAPDFRPCDVAVSPALLDAPAWCAGDPSQLR